MILKIQIYSLIVSFVFGIFVYFLLEFMQKFIYNNKLYIRLIFSLLFSFFISIVYFLLMLKINNGILHNYFFLMIILGYLFTKFVYFKLFEKK